MALSSSTPRTPGAPTPKLTLNYGLRLDIINPQAVNEAGNGGWLRHPTPARSWSAAWATSTCRATSKNKVNWAPRLGVTYQINDKTVIRAGYGRSYDIGVFGSTFGHTVTQNLPVLSAPAAERAQQLRRACSTSPQGPPAPVFPAVPANGRFPLPNGVVRPPAARQQRLSHVDAYNVTLQRELTPDALRRGRLRGQPGHDVFIGDNPAVERQPADARRLPDVPTTSAGRSTPAPCQRRRLRRRLRLDAGHRLLQQRAARTATTPSRRS